MFSKIRSELRDVDNEGRYKLIRIAIISVGIITALFVLYQYPRPGVSDQGDFQRVMTVTGLDEIDRYSTDFKEHWYKYVTPYYKLVELNPLRLFGVIPTTSLIYPITAARAIGNLLGNKYFSTYILSGVYLAAYLIGIYACFRFVKIKSISTYAFFLVLSILILLDGNYLIWFNSLYGEPMVIVSITLFSASILYASIKGNNKNSKAKAFIIISSFLFLGSKLQCFVATPLIIFIVVRLFLVGEEEINIKKLKKSLGLPIFLIVFYVGGIYLQINGSCGVDTEYNSVFFGILKSSENPEKDLEVLGLPSDMAGEAGKHAYLPKEEYNKYIPWSDLTKNEFNHNISNLKLLKFYLMQPGRLIKGMEYTASQSFDTRGYLGKFEKLENSDYTYTFNRFTLWSDFRSSKLPKELLFISLFYIVVTAISAYEYVKSKDKTMKTQIELFWVIAIIGLMQFPLPYIGNGEADTQKQLFLFNFTFDITFLIGCTWIFHKICLLTKMTLSNFRGHK